jgi:hypothetical protein
MYYCFSCTITWELINSFYEILYGDYAVGTCFTIVHFYFLQLVIPTWRTLRVIRWDDEDSITHDPLHMCYDFIILDEGHLQWCPYALM